MPVGYALVALDERMQKSKGKVTPLHISTMSQGKRVMPVMPAQRLASGGCSSAWAVLSQVPLSGALLLFGSGLLGLTGLGVYRRLRS